MERKKRTTIDKGQQWTKYLASNGVINADDSFSQALKTMLSIKAVGKNSDKFKALSKLVDVLNNKIKEADSALAEVRIKQSEEAIKRLQEEIERERTKLLK